MDLVGILKTRKERKLKSVRKIKAIVFSKTDLSFCCISKINKHIDLKRSPNIHSNFHGCVWGVNCHFWALVSYYLFDLCTGCIIYTIGTHLFARSISHINYGQESHSIKYIPKDSSY